LFRVIAIGFTVLVLVVVTSLVASMLTRGLAKKIDKTNVANTSQNVTPAPKERSIYLDLPKDFPRDIPLPASAKVTVKEEDGDSWKAAFLVAGEASSVRNFYLSSLPALNWKIIGQSQAAGLTIFNLNKDGREAIIAIGNTDGGTSVSLTILKGQ